MSILEDIHTSISEMTDEELSETFRQIRLSRRVAVQKKKKPQTKRKISVKATAPPVSAISPELAALLLAKLEGN